MLPTVSNINFTHGSADIVKQRERKSPDRLTLSSRARPLTGENAIAKFNRGVDHLCKAAISKPSRHFKKALELFKEHPRSSLAQFNQGLCYMGLNKWEEALNAMALALKYNKWAEHPEKMQVCRALVKEMIDKRKIPLSTNGENILFNEACRLTNEMQYQEAIALFESLPNNGLINFNLGQCYLSFGNREKAYKSYVDCVNCGGWPGLSDEQMYKYFDEAYIQIGNILLINAENAGNKEDKKDLKDQAIIALLFCSEPKSGPVCYTIGKIYEQEGRGERAGYWYGQCLKNEWAHKPHHEVNECKEKAADFIFKRLEGTNT